MDSISLDRTKGNGEISKKIKKMSVGIITDETRDGPRAASFRRAKAILFDIFKHLNVSM